MGMLDRLRFQRGKDFPWFTHPKFVFPDLECVTKENGRYYISPEGEKLYSMTTMLGATGDHTWLEAWEQKLGKENAAKEKQRCADRGSAVHDACEKYVNNVDFEECRQTAQNYEFMFKQIKNALDGSLSKCWATEECLYSNIFKIAGRVDLIGTWKGKAAILDYKTSNNIKTDSMLDNYKVQLTGYSLCFEEMFGFKIPRIVNIISNEKSMQPTIFEYDRDDYVDEFKRRVALFQEMKGGLNLP